MTTLAALGPLILPFSVVGGDARSQTAMRMIWPCAVRATVTCAWEVRGAAVTGQRGGQCVLAVRQVQEMKVAVDGGQRLVRTLDQARPRQPVLECMHAQPGCELGQSRP